MQTRLTLALLLCVFGCEGKAQHGSEVSPERLSLAQETCSRTADCTGELRCIDSICQQASRSDVGDYHLAAGELALSAGESEAAITSLRAAEAEYKRSGDVPTDVDCALGSALATLRSDPLKGEEAAAKLHRCLTGLVDGSVARDRALTALAQLRTVGFDASHLASAEPSDRYLTLAPTKKTFEDIRVVASADRKTKRKTFVDFMAALDGAEAKAAITPCWRAYFEATKKEALSVTLPYRYSFYLDPDDESGDRGTLKTTKYTSSADNASATARKCIDDGLAKMAAKLARSGGEYSWTAKITISAMP